MNMFPMWLGPQMLKALKFLISDKTIVVFLLQQSLAFYHSLQSCDIPLLPSP